MNAFPAPAGVSVADSRWFWLAVAVLYSLGWAGLASFSHLMLVLLGAGLLSAALVSPVLQLFMPRLTEKPPGMAGVFAFLYGDFVGQLILAPLLVLVARAHLRRLDPALCLAILLHCCSR